MAAKLWLLRVHPRFIRYTTVVAFIGTVFGMFIFRSGTQTYQLENNECFITEPLLGKQHPDCFLQKYCLNYTLHPKNICRQPEQVQLFVFIFSLPDNSHYRQLIRDTWLNQTLFSAKSLQHVFLLAHDDKSNGTKLMLEAEANNDIVLLDMRESFCHLTLKALAGLQLAGDICPHASFVMKADDDVLINMFMLQEKLHSLRVQRRAERVIMGNVWYGANAMRSGQYAVSKLQYAPSTYPPFCSGAAYIMSMDVAKLLSKLAMEDQSKALLHLDDPYLTGVLANRAKLAHTQLGKLYSWNMRYNEDMTDGFLRNHMMLHLHDTHYTTDTQRSYELHVIFWRRLVKLNSQFGMAIPE